MFDTHAHLTDPGLNFDLEGVLKRAGEAGVRWILTAATDLESSREALKVAAEHDSVLAAVGVHPECAGAVEPGWEVALEELIVQGKPCAIGECGLDAFHPNPPIEAQVPIFRAQVRIARKHRLPLLLHSRRAAEEVLRILKEEDALTVGGVFHCIESDEIFARAAVNAGYHLGVGGTCTFPRNDVLRNMLKRMPLDRILLETDCPYLAPQPVRGKTNEPAFMVHTAEVVAKAAGIAVADLVKVTTKNALRLFRMDVQ